MATQILEDRNVKVRPMRHRSTAAVPNPEQPLCVTHPHALHQCKCVLPRRSRPWQGLRTRSYKLLASSREIRSLVRECTREICSLAHRIRIAYRHRFDLHGVDLGEFFERTPAGTYRVSRQSHACSVDIERLLAKRPWLTAVDLSLAAEAWSMGAKWCARRHRE